MLDPAYHTVGTAELAVLFGDKIDEITRVCGPSLSTVDLGFYRIAPEERDQLIRDAVARTDPGADLPTVGKDRLVSWQMAWAENLQEFIYSGSLDALVPKYIQPNNVIRLLGDYARPTNPDFVSVYTNIYRKWLAQRFFADAEAIYEFGSGSASHVAFFAQNFPDKAIVGLDWTVSSQEIIALVARRYGWNVIGRQFDFFSPDRDLRLPAGTVVLTFGALEQVGTDYEAFLEYLLANRPLRCVHVEGINELYEPELLLDYLALRYHRKRHYLWNLLTRLRQLQQCGRAIIETVHRQHFGNRHDDTYSIVVWRPA